MIPKRLTTTWICDSARDPYTDLHRDMFARCLQSWLRLMPDYSLTVITLGNVWDICGPDPWAEALAEDGNFIGVAHYALYTDLLRHGGVHLDMDVEAVQRFDPLLSERCVIGHLGQPDKPRVNVAVLASEPGHPFLVNMLDGLKACDPARQNFGNDGGPFLSSRLLRERGWSGVNEDARLSDGIVVKRSAAFYPYLWTEDYSPACHQPDTLAVHHWGQSWLARVGKRETHPRRWEAACAS
jgi:hypothetical protein